MAILWIIAGLMAAALGGSVWAIIGHVTGYEIGYVAIALGALVGFAVASAAGKRAGLVTAFASSVFALAGVVVGQLGILWLDMDSALRAIRGTRISDDLATSYIAEDIAQERTKAGIELNWPQNPDESDPASVFPPDVWTDAQTEWTTMTASERENFRDSLMENAVAQASDIDLMAYLTAGLDAKSIIFYVIAIGAAFKLGMGRGGPALIRSAQAAPPAPEAGSWLTRLTPANTSAVEPLRAAPSNDNKPHRAGGLPDIPTMTGLPGMPAAPASNAPRAERPAPAAKPAEGGIFRPDRLAS